MDNILLIIAARGGSKGVPDKNIREIGGLPLIVYSIKQAKEWGRAAHIICSTDSEHIAKIAAQYGAEIPFMRPLELAGDTVGKIDVIRHALKQMESMTGEEYKIVVDLDVTSPVRKIADIEGAFQLFIKKKPKSLFSVVPARKNPYFNMVEENVEGYAELVKKSSKMILRRQDASKVYDMNASIYFYDRDYLLDEKTQSAISDRSLVWIMADNSAVDIDTENDFQFVEYLMKKGLIKL